MLEESWSIAPAELVAEPAAVALELLGHLEMRLAGAVQSNTWIALSCVGLNFTGLNLIQSLEELLVPSFVFGLLAQLLFVDFLL